MKIIIALLLISTVSYSQSKVFIHGGNKKVLVIDWSIAKNQVINAFGYYRLVFKNPQNDSCYLLRTNNRGKTTFDWPDNVQFVGGWEPPNTRNKSDYFIMKYREGIYYCQPVLNF